MPGPLRATSAVLIALACSSSAFAEIMVLDSVEWLVCSSAVAVVGRVEGIETVKGPHDVVYEDCTVSVKRSLKGPVEEGRFAFTLRRVGASPSARPFLESKHDVLFLLEKSENHGPEKRLDGRWVPTKLHPLSLIDLSKIGKVYSRETKPVTDRNALLTIVEEWADSPIAHSLYRDVPFESEAFADNWAGSSVMILVPAEERYRAEFLKLARSENPAERARGAAQLGKYPGEETVKVLRGLLDDTSESRSSYCADQIARVDLHVRKVAVRSLRELGEEVPDLVLEREPTANEQRELRETYWTGAFREALGEGWTIEVQDVRTKSIPGPAGDTYPWTQTIVAVTCRRGDDAGTFTLVPKRWPSDDWPTTTYLGTNGPQSQCGRRFHYDGELPDDTRKRVVQYFGLEK